MIKVLPSSNPEKEENLVGYARMLEDLGVEYLHCDVMDGEFVESKWLDIETIRKVRNNSNILLDIHLMVNNPSKVIENYISLKPSIITIHYESIRTPKEIIELSKRVRSKDILFGVSIKPNTPSSQVLPYVELVDMVLVMTVEPGFGGQSFMHDTMTKVKEIREYAIKNDLNLDIEVDGGINNETIKIAKNAGANIFVVGTAFYKSEKLPIASEIIG